jgi:hypothetical protein
MFSPTQKLGSQGPVHFSLEESNELFDSAQEKLSGKRPGQHPELDARKLFFY